MATLPEHGASRTTRSEPFRGLSVNRGTILCPELHPWSEAHYWPTWQAHTKG